MSSFEARAIMEQAIRRRHTGRKSVPFLWLTAEMEASIPFLPAVEGEKIVIPTKGLYGRHRRLLRSY
jgi:hypothetical protein